MFEFNKYDIIKNVCSNNLNKHYNYVKCPTGLYINYIDGTDFSWSMCIDGKLYEGNTLKELSELIKIIKKDLVFDVKDTTVNVNILPVFVFALHEVKAFFGIDYKQSDYEAIFGDCLALRDAANLVPVSCIEDLATDYLYIEDTNINKADLLCKFAREALKEYSSDNKIFKTCASKAKDIIKRRAPELNSVYMKMTFPDQDAYFFIRHKCFRASVCMNNDFRKVYENVFSFDQSSAHAHKLVTKDFPIDKPVKVHKDDYHTLEGMSQYMENYWCWFTANLKGVKAINSNLDPFKVKNRHELCLHLDHIQWKAFGLLYTFDEVIFEGLYISKLGKAPLWFRKCVADMYINKAEYTTKDAHRNQLKVTLNSGSYGIIIQKIYDYWENDEEMTSPRHFTNSEWLDIINDRFIPIQIGTSITSYVMYDEISIISKDPDSFAYCDTDSIKFVYSSAIIEAIKDRNNESMIEVEEFCKEYGYDYDIMQGLGRYELDGTYLKFKAISPKEYVYIDSDGKWGATTAGYASHYKADTSWNCKKKYIPVSLYEPLSNGKDPFTMFNPLYRYTDYKWIWDKEKLCVYKVKFKVNHEENIELYKKLSKGY